MAAGRWADERADPRSLLHAFFGQLHGLLSDALTTNQGTLFPNSEPERLARIYKAASAAIGDAHALVERLDEQTLRGAGIPAEMLKLMLERWSLDLAAYESQLSRQPGDLARSLHTADTLLLHGLTAVVPKLQELLGWLLLIRSELEAPAASAFGLSPSPAVVDAATAPMATGVEARWQVDERSDEPVLQPGAGGR